jgi:aryl sulfotransferase
MGEQPVRYRSADEDSARWLGFPFRPGDIVISTRSKSGTTWMQMICALLVFGTPQLPEPLSELSPWLDWLITPREVVYARLEAQRHRRFIKTHTPLDGIPIDSLATYIVVGRHPLDMAVSLYHQGNNMNRERLRELTGQPAPSQPGPAKPRRPVRDWLVAWIDSDDRPADELDSLPGVLWHLSDAWARRDQPNIVLMHYDDLSSDLSGQMRRLATLLGITVPQDTWPSLVRSATFEQMRASAARSAPDPAGVLRDPVAFFRRGSSGAGREVLSAEELAHYYQRAARLASPELLAWLHRQPGMPMAGRG